MPVAWDRQTDTVRVMFAIIDHLGFQKMRYDWNYGEGLKFEIGFELI